MKKLIYTAIVIIIQYSTFNTQNSFAQAVNDNTGSGNCLSFDGNDYVNIAASSVWDFGAGDFTAECWVYLNSFGTRAIYTSWNGNAGGVGFGIMPENDGKVYFYLGCGGSGSPCNGNTGWISSNTFQIGEWQHLAAVKTGTTMQLYNNGILVASGPIPASVQTLTSNRPIKIGRRYNDATSWLHHGQIDDVRLWNTARSQSQIRSNMNKKLTGNETNLVGYWNMNEGTGSTVNDLTVNGNNGTRH